LLLPRVRLGCAPMRVRVLFFASARDAAGCPGVDLVLRDGATVREACAALGERFPPLRARLPHLLFAVDEEYARLEAALREGSELAVIPPVSGG
jgi:molybdopterin converting factor subunit 1